MGRDRDWDLGYGDNDIINNPPVDGAGGLGGSGVRNRRNRHAPCPTEGSHVTAIAGGDHFGYTNRICSRVVEGTSTDKP